MGDPKYRIELLRIRILNIEIEQQVLHITNQIVCFFEETCAEIINIHTSSCLICCFKPRAPDCWPCLYYWHPTGHQPAASVLLRPGAACESAPRHVHRASLARSDGSPDLPDRYRASAADRTCPLPVPACWRRARPQ